MARHGTGWQRREQDHWDLDHPFERILVDTAVAPDPAAVSWINPRLTPGETRRVLTGIPGKTGVVYTLDRATGEFLWAPSTVTQNVISSIDGATGDVIENAEVVFSAEGHDVLACPTWIGGKDWESVYRSPAIPMDPVFVGKTDGATVLDTGMSMAMAAVGTGANWSARRHPGGALASFLPRDRPAGRSSGPTVTGEAPKTHRTVNAACGWRT